MLVHTTMQKFLNEDRGLNQILIDIANDLSEKLHCDRHGSCVHFAELFAEKVNQINPELLNLFFVIEGYVNWSLESSPQQHTWIELEDETKIDPTFTQFTKYGKASYSNRIYKKYTGLEYLKETEGSWFQERREKFPEYIFKDVNNS